MFIYLKWRPGKRPPVSSCCCATDFASVLDTQWNVDKFNCFDWFKADPASGGMVINVNAGVVASPDQTAEVIAELLARRGRLNGGKAYESGF